MKRPSIRFDKESLVQLLLDHGEKIGVAIVAAVAGMLVWQGVNAARTKTAGRELQPAIIEEQAGRAATHIQAVKQPPAEEVRRTSLTTLIEPWRKPEVQQPPPVALFNKPLFEERTRRSKPEVFPIEELRAVAGIAFMPERPADVAVGRSPDLDAPEDADGKGSGKRRRKERNPGGPGGVPGMPPGMPPGFSEFGPGMMPPEMMPPGMAATVKGRLVPYCVVTGLIPVAKQSGEYTQRFAQAGLRDPQRDIPYWSDYLVERMVVTPDGREDWKRIDLKQFYGEAAKQWAGLQPEQLPPGFMLSAEQNPGAAFGYCSPLPLLAGEAWGFDALHPWFVAKLKEQMEEQQRLAAEQAEQAATILPGQQPGAAPGFGAPGGEFAPGGPGFVPGTPEMMPQGMQLDATGRPIPSVDYSLFRFVDTSVEPGKTYRYRVRLSLWNPNRDLEPRHLSDASLAKDVKLPSVPSNVTDPVSVPGTSTLLVRALRKAESKRFKPGMVEVLVLDKGSETGGYALRSLTTEPGGLVNVDKRLNKPGNARSRGEDIATEAVLVDVRGRQEDRAETRSGKGSPPPEPLAMLFLQPDGSFTVASAAESQARVDRHIGTLPVAEDPKAGRDKPALNAPENPFGAPFGR
ncbi:MAG: hypothetical protein EBS56_03445 [Planctomycetia bacterium]|nr:hypothetical protein [Planctomycetia bacterium]